MVPDMWHLSFMCGFMSLAPHSEKTRVFMVLRHTLWRPGALVLLAWSCGALVFLGSWSSLDPGVPCDGLWTCGLVDLWTCGLVDLWTCGLVDLWTCGPCGAPQVFLLYICIIQQLYKYMITTLVALHGSGGACGSCGACGPCGEVSVVIIYLYNCCIMFVIY